MTIPNKKLHTEVDEAIAINQDEKIESIGARLSKARIARGEQLDRIAKNLKISQIYLEALENDDRSALPEQVYTLGFLKSYASYLGLDGNELAQTYKTKFSHSSTHETLTFPTPAAARTIPSRALVAVASVLSILVICAWFILRPSRDAVDEFRHLPAETAIELQKNSTAVENKNEVAPSAVKQGKEAYTQPYPVFPIQDARPYQETRAAQAVFVGNDIYLAEGNSLVILATSETWIGIKSKDGNSLINRTFKPGETQEINAQEGLVLSTGNAGGVSFYVSGKYFESLGKSGAVLTAMNLRFEDPKK